MVAKPEKGKTHEHQGFSLNDGKKKRNPAGQEKGYFAPLHSLSTSPVFGGSGGKQAAVASPPSTPVFGMTVEHRRILFVAQSERRQDAEKHPVLAEGWQGGL